MAYRSEADCLAQYSQDNNLALNGHKTKELVVDFKRKRQTQDPFTINGSAVERVGSIKYLGGSKTSPGRNTPTRW